MLANLFETWAQATVRDIVLTLLGLVVLGGGLLLLGRKRVLRNLTEEHFHVAGIAVVGLVLVSFAIYNRYFRVQGAWQHPGLLALRATWAAMPSSSIVARLRARLGTVFHFHLYPSCLPARGKGLAGLAGSGSSHGWDIPSNRRPVWKILGSCTHEDMVANCLHPSGHVGGV